MSSVVLQDQAPRRLARRARLRYTSDLEPGIQREVHNKTFIFKFPNGKIVRSKKILERIRKLVIPPAWTKVWICMDPNGHLQATGRDSRGRKQYRYHPKWATVRDENKFSRIVVFGRKIPSIRKRIQEHLSLPGLPREKVLATVVQLLEKSLIRVGNLEYAKTNNSYGLTTFKNKHVKINGSVLKFRFRGKGGKEYLVGIKNARIARIVKRCQEISGQQLFQYIEDGEQKSVTSTDVNDYLRNIAGEEFSAKDFRTWAGTVQAAVELQTFEEFESDTQGKRNIVEAIKRVAHNLGNTPAICRKCYIHPYILESYSNGEMNGQLRCKPQEECDTESTSLSPQERAVLAFLEKKFEKSVAA
jgi:DNA topoisomerase I